MEIECSSAVSKVVVHARGALVTRQVTLPPDLPAGVVDLALPGITVAAQAGSARAAVEGSERLVAAVQSSIVVPSGAKPGATVTKVRELVARRARLEDELRVLVTRRGQLAQMGLSPGLRPHDGNKRQRDALDVRFAETLAMAKLLTGKVAELDERIFAIEREQRDVSLAIEAARLEDAQASSKERMGEEHPTRRFVVRLTGGGTGGRLLLTYAVLAARWWPTYTLRMEDGGDRATWAFEALVAQRTGEDWNAVLLALSSADLVFDARLPELASLRFGRAQPPKRRPIRSAPAGVDEMFGGYAAFLPTTTTPPPMAQPSPTQAGFAMPRDEVDDVLTMVLSDEEESNVAPKQDGREQSKRRQSASEGGGYGGVPPGMPVQQGPAPGGAMPRNMPPPQAMMRGAPLMAKSAGIGGILSGFAGGGGAKMDDYEDLGSFSEAAPELEPELVAGDQWSDLDALVLAGASEARRGKLVPRPASFDRAAIERDVALVNSVAKERWVDPFESRGMFDHRYEAMGRADVPSDGRVHRASVATVPCNVLITWRAVPSEAPEVYREAHVINPFEQALLGGPVDVYLDGSLLAETTSTRIDSGGTLWCGMGVDDRVKIARNVRAEEESAGLLGGSLAVTHTVGIELTSTIKDPIKVVVLERVPVTDDKAIEVKIVKATPVPTTYDQADRGSPVRGGCRFETAVGPGKPTTLEIVYRLVFASKLDIVGGSRRG